MERQHQTPHAHTQTRTHSVVITPGHHFLACGAQDDGVLKLCGVAALDVTQRRVGVNDALQRELESLV